MARPKKPERSTIDKTDAVRLLKHIIDYYSPVYPEYYRFGQECARLYGSYLQFAQDVRNSNLPRERKKEVLRLQFAHCEGVIDKSDLPPVVKTLLKGALYSILTAS